MLRGYEWSSRRDLTILPAPQSGPKLQPPCVPQALADHGEMGEIMLTENFQEKDTDAKH